MKALLYVIALLAIGGAAFFSNTNKGKMLEQQQTRVDLIQTNKTVSATADKTQKELNTETDNLKTARSEKAEVEQNIDKLRSDETSLQRELADIDIIFLDKLPHRRCHPEFIGRGVQAFGGARSI